MKSQQELASKSADKLLTSQQWEFIRECEVKGKRLISDPAIVVDDITSSYRERPEVVQILNIITNKDINMKNYIAELEALGIPAENIGLSACG